MKPPDPTDQMPVVKGCAIAVIIGAILYLAAAGIYFATR